jgi:Lrp/AsnC family transcriptional regulator for asnA, asnC and gidA
MEQRGILKGATTQLNVNCFGYEAAATLLVKVNPQQVELAMDLIKEIGETRVYRQYNSSYNIRAMASLTDLTELDRLKQIIRERLPNSSFRSYIWMGTRNVPENLNLTDVTDLDKKATVFKKSVTPPIDFTVDNLDLKITKHLTVNGRRSFSDIAKDIDVSNHTVIKRYNRLKENGALKVLAQINLAKIGYAAIIDLNIAFTTIRGLSINIVDLIAKIPNVIVITKISGDFDLQVTAVIKSLEHALSLQDEIAKIDGVTQIEASMRRIPEKWPTSQQQISTI